MFSKMHRFVFSHDIEEVPTKHDTLKQILCLVNGLGVRHSQVAKDTPHWMGPYLGGTLRRLPNTLESPPIDSTWKGPSKRTKFQGFCVF